MNEGRPERWILVAFAMRYGMDEVTADLAVSEVLSGRGPEQISLANATEVLDELARWPRSSSSMHQMVVHGIWHNDDTAGVDVWCETCSDWLGLDADRGDQLTLEQIRSGMAAHEAGS